MNNEIFEFVAEQNLSGVDNFVAPTDGRVFKKLHIDEYVVMPYMKVEGRAKGTTLLYTPQENKFYTAKAYGRYGRDYRCRDRTCCGKLTMLPSGELVKTKFSTTHRCIGSVEEEYKVLKVTQALKEQSEAANSIGGGGGLLPLREIFVGVLLE